MSDRDTEAKLERIPENQRRSERYIDRGNLEGSITEIVRAVCYVMFLPMKSQENLNL